MLQKTLYSTFVQGLRDLMQILYGECQFPFLINFFLNCSFEPNFSGHNAFYRQKGPRETPSGLSIFKSEPASLRVADRTLQRLVRREEDEAGTDSHRHYWILGRGHGGR